MKLLGSMLLLIGLGTVAFAQDVDQVPEINPATAVNAVCLIAGAALVFRGRHKK